MSFQSDASSAYPNGSPVSKSDVRGLWGQVDNIVATLNRVGFIQLPSSGLGGTSNAITAQLPTNAPLATINGNSTVIFSPLSQNTGAVTLNVAGSGAKPLVTEENAALPAGYLKINRLYIIQSWGENWRIIGGGLSYNDLLSQVTMLLAATRSGAVWATANVSGTADAISAEMASGAVAAGVNTVGQGEMIWFTPSAPNTSDNPTLTIGGTTFDVRSETGGTWAAGRFSGGQAYILQRRSGQLRVVVGNVTSKLLNDSIAAETAARAAADDARSLAMRDGTLIGLQNIGGTGDAITADIHSTMVSAGIANLSTASQIEYVPVVGNSAQNPTITIGGTTFNVRDADGAAWPVSDPAKGDGFIAGRSYYLRRRGTVMRVVAGNGYSKDTDAKLVLRTAAMSDTGTIPLTSVAGTAQAITASIPASLTAVGISSIPTDGVVSIRPASTTTATNPTLTVGGTTFTIKDADDTDVAAGALKSGRTYLLRRSGTTTTMRIVAGAISTGDLTAALATEASARASLDTRLTGFQTEVNTRPYLHFARQTSGALPARPVATIVHWYTWDDPSALMTASDLWFKLQQPVEPLPPASETWRWSQKRDGSTGVIQILSVPEQNPPLTAVKYSLDGGADVSLPAAPGIYEVTGLTQDQTYLAELKYTNYIGDSIMGEVKSMTVTNQPFTDDFNRADAPLSSNAWWVDRQTPSNRRIVIRSNQAQGQGSNETYIVELDEYLPPDQFAQATVVNEDVSNNSSPRGLTLAIRSRFDTSLDNLVGYNVRFVNNTFTLTRRNADGSSSTLASGATKAGQFVGRIQAVGSTISVVVDGVTVASVSDSTFASGGALVRINTTGASGPNSVQFDNFSAGPV